MNFNSFQLKELASIQTGPFGSQLHKEDYCEIGTPIVTVEHLGQKNFGTQNLPKVSEDDRERLKKYLLKTGDVVFSRVGSVDRCSYVSAEFNEWLFSGRCLRIRVTEEKLNPEYLYYYFCQDYIKEYIRRVAVGATMPSINTKIMGEIPVSLPSRKEQDKIVSVLSSFDDLIEINNKIIDVFDEYILACSGEILKEDAASKDVLLGDVCEFIAGYSYKGSELEPSDIALATIKNFNRRGGFSVAGFKPINPSKKVKEQQYVGLFDILVAHTDLTQKAEIVGNAEMIMDLGDYQEAIASMDLVKVVPKDNCIPKSIIYAVLKSNYFKRHCLGYVNGTTVLHLNKKALKEFRFRITSDKQKIEKISGVLSNSLHMISLLMKTNKVIRDIRDTLMPKLLSGEIVLSN